MSGGHYAQGQYGQNAYYYDSNNYPSSPSHSYYSQDASSPASSSGYSMSNGNGATGDAYQCLFANCNSAFSRPTDLQRHYQTVHRGQGQPLIECPHRWCGRTGDRGFTRQDHFRDHLREVHQQDLPKSRKRPTSKKAS